MNTDDLAEAIAVSLNVEREAAGWKLGDLANELGLSEQTLGRYLTRRTRSIPVDVLTRASAVIGVSVADVITRAQERLAAQEDREIASQAADIAAEARRDAARPRKKRPAKSTRTDRSQRKT